MGLPIAQALLEDNQDLVVPRYTGQKFKGLLNSCIVSPLTRSLYGKRIHNPMGPDLGVSRRLFERVLGAERPSNTGGAHPLASLASTALCNNLKVCEVHLGARIYPPTDWENISSLLAQVLAPIFLDMERNAACWQRTRGSVPVPVVGDLRLRPRKPKTWIEPPWWKRSNWGIATFRRSGDWCSRPPLCSNSGKLSRLSAEQFHMPDELWARIIYDFALAHRLQNNQSRSPAPVHNTPVPGVGRLLCAGIASCRRGTARATNRASGARIRSGQAILDFPLAVA